MEEKFQSESRCRRRNTKESLRELAQDLQRLMNLAYPVVNSHVFQSTLLVTRSYQHCLIQNLS